MLKGAESGTPAQGGGDGSDPKAVAADESEVKTLTAAQLSARLSKMDKDAQKLLVSFYTMRNILRDGGAQDLMALQSINFSGWFWWCCEQYDTKHLAEQGRYYISIW